MPGHNPRLKGKPRRCKYCDRVFTKEEHLKRHERVHTGEKPFRCYKCGKSYARSDVLFRHLQKHPLGRNGSQDEDQVKHLSLSGNVAKHIDGSSGDHQSSPVSPLTMETPLKFLNTLNPEALDPVSRTCAQYALSNSDIAMPITSRTNLQRQSTPRGHLNDYYQGQRGSSAQTQDKDTNRLDSSKQYDKAKSLPHPQKRANASHDSSFSHSVSATPQDSKIRTSSDQLATFPEAEMEQSHCSKDYDGSTTFSFGTEQMPVIGNTQVNFDFFNFSHSDSFGILHTMPTEYEESRRRCSDGTVTTRGSQVQEVQPSWSRERPKIPIRITDRLWNQVINHNADNIFTQPQHSLSSGSLDHKCRSRLIQYCLDLDSSYRSSFTAADEMIVPPVEVLDSSLDFYFQFFHPVLPIIHKGTFDASNTPSPLLLSMCLVGLSYLDQVETKDFLVRNLENLLQVCHRDLTSQVLAERTPFDVLSTFATTMIVAYLALGFRNNINIRQAYVLCAQTLREADEKYLFAAGDGDNPLDQLVRTGSDPDNFWKAWARIESVKRLICCLIYLDMAYARLMNSTGVIEIDKIKIHLPCDDGLFNDATTSESFFLLIQRGAHMKMPRMSMQNFHATPALTLNEDSAQILLRSLYLKVVAAHSMLSNKETRCLDYQSYSPVERLAIEQSFRELVADIVLLPRTHPIVLGGRHSMNALGWHYLCITLTADIDLLETACGRDGLEAAAATWFRVYNWSQSNSARRALLHAAQIFQILDSCRIRESYVTRPDLVLFVAALVMSQYFLITNHNRASLNTRGFELLQHVDWTLVGAEGLGKASGRILPSVATFLGQESATFTSVRDFLKNGSRVSFAGVAQGPDGVTAKKVARKFAHVMGDFGKWDGCHYSQLLRTMCEFKQGVE